MEASWKAELVEDGTCLNAPSNDGTWDVRAGERP